ncbi:MAG: hypothetical protein WCS20_11685 [Alphaproteobacteria bacterium]|jgi:hypothetical protein
MIIHQNSIALAVKGFPARFTDAFLATRCNVSKGCSPAETGACGLCDAAPS